MKKFAAHYVLTPSGHLLKDGMAVVQDNGTLQFIDTKGALVEAEQMIFHSGMLMGAFEFTKREDATYNAMAKEEPYVLFGVVLQKDHLALNEVIELAIQLQDHFPQMNVPQILNKIEQVFLSGGLIKNTVPGLYLLSGLDLGHLRFTAATRLKKII